ncbi:MAG: hypothetical protein F4203_09215 [Rhodobacteraceae bacterium]|nr:hypothetical protein [Paracoccaceae bacterium]MDE2738400.1 hypothetical protein [Paracoccaceae bacterium]MYE37777.1 hypothetical protein [Paracoccaceae bacterium]MYG43290.1 hypothetical protein [Paracoccaceae bacterium]
MNNQLRLILAIFVIGLTMAGTTNAETKLPAFENLSFLEKPLAADLGFTTLALKGALEGLIFDYAGAGGENGTGFNSNFQVSALTQLPNRWRLDVSYFGEDVDDKYTDKTTVSIGGVWGTLMAGNVYDTVREQTRRQPGAGNASLAFDDFIGKTDDSGAGYSGRFGPWIVSGYADGEGGVDLGAVYQRPQGTKDYRFTLRTISGTHMASNDVGEPITFDTEGLGIVGELVYGRSIFDVGFGYERFKSEEEKAKRRFVSAGARTKIDNLTISLEGHYGAIEDDEEVSTALGIQYDISRGLSANFGINHSKAKETSSSIRNTDTEETKAILSLRYTF